MRFLKTCEDRYPKLLNQEDGYYISSDNFTILNNQGKVLGYVTCKIDLERFVFEPTNAR